MKRKITKISPLLLFLFSLLLVAACNLGQALSTPTPSDTPSPIITPLASATPFPLAGDLGWGAIRGKITDATTGAPIVNARITCDHYSYTSPATCQGDTFTDKDGNYSFINIFFHDTDTIHLWVSALGYEPKEFEQSFFTFPELVSDFALSPSTTIITPPTPIIMCTPPLCAIGTSEVYYCPGNCPGGCGTTCATYTPAP